MIDRSKPDYVGINIFTQNYDSVRNIVESIRTDCTLFVGGEVVKSVYQRILDWNVTNPLNIVIGEGEYIYIYVYKKRYMGQYIDAIQRIIGETMG